MLLLSKENKAAEECPPPPVNKLLFSCFPGCFLGSLLALLLLFLDGINHKFDDEPDIKNLDSKE